MLFNRISRGANKLNRVVRRGAADDGWLRKNMKVEELAAFRETTYKSYQFSPKEFLTHSVLLFIPVFTVTYWVGNDMKADYTRIGRPDFNFSVGPLREEVAATSEENEE